MLTFIYLISFICVLGILAYHRLSRHIFTVTIAALLVLGTLANVTGIISWLTFTVIALPLNIAILRKKIITQSALKHFKKIIP